MSFEVLPALAGGLVGTVVMSAMMQMAGSMGLTRMPPMHLVVGSMMSGDPRKASRIGILIHYLLMGTVVFGSVYGVLFAAFDESSVAIGATIGLVHGLVVGLMGMPMMPAIHPRMSAGRSVSGAVVTVESGQVLLSAPGFLGAGWGGMTPVGMIVGHVVYGVVVALVYSSLA